MKKIKRFINKLLQYETMDGDGACPIYLERWVLFSLGKKIGFAVYLHHFIGDDWAIDPHDHPKRFISIGLKGSYIEQTYYQVMPEKFSLIDEIKVKEKKFTAPWIRSFPAHHLHRIRMGNKITKDGKCMQDTCWTLVITLKAVRKWGFVMRGKWIFWREYIDIFGKERKSC